MPTKYGSLVSQTKKPTVKKSVSKSTGVTASKKPGKSSDSTQKTKNDSDAQKSIADTTQNQQQNEQQLQWFQAKLSDQERNIDELQFAYQQIQGEKSALDRQIQQKNSQLNAQQQLLGQLQVELNDLRGKQEENDVLRNKNDFLEKQMDAFRRLQGVHKHLQDENALLKEESERINGEMEILRKENDELKEKTNQLEKEAKQSKSTQLAVKAATPPEDLKQLESQHAKLKIVAGKLKEELKQTINQLNQQKEASDRFKTQAKSKIQQLQDQLNEQIQQAEVKANQHRDELEVVKSALNLSTEELQRVKLQYNADQTEVKTLRDELLEVQNQLQFAQTSLNRKNKQINDLADLANQQATKFALQDSAVMCSSGAQMLEQENERLRERIQQLAKEIDGNIFKQNQGIQSNIAALNKQLQEVRMENIQKDAQIQALDAELRKQTLMAHNAMAGVPMVKQLSQVQDVSVAVKKQEPNQNNAEYIEKIANLSAKMTDLEAKNRELQLELQRREQSVQRTESHGKELDALQAQLEANVVEKQRKIEELEEEMQQMQRENDSLKSQNASMSHKNDATNQQITELFAQLKCQAAEAAELKRRLTAAAEAASQAEHRAKVAEAALGTSVGNAAEQNFEKGISTSAAAKLTPTTQGAMKGVFGAPEAPANAEATRRAQNCTHDDLTRDDLNGVTLRGLNPINAGSNIKDSAKNHPIHFGATDRVDQLKTQIQYLHNQLKQKNAALEEQLTENDKLQQQLIKQVLEATEKQQNFPDENQQGDQQDTYINKENNDMLSRISNDHRHKILKMQETFDTQLKEQIEQYETLKKKYFDLKQQFDARNELLNSTERNTDEMQAQLMQYKDLTNQLKDKLIQVKERLKETREQLNQKQTELGALQRDFLQIKAQLQETTRELEVLRLQSGQEARYKADCDALDERIKQLQTFLKEKEDKIKTLQQELEIANQLVMKHQFSEQTIQQLKMEFESSKTHNERLSTQVVELYEKLRQTETVKQGLEQQLNDMHKQNQNLQISVQSAMEGQNQVTALQQQLTEQTARLSKQERQLLDQQEQLNQLLDAKNNLQMQNNRLASLHIKQVSKKLQYAVLQDRDQSVAQLSSAARFLQVPLSLAEVHTIVKNKFLVNKDLKELVLQHLEKMLTMDLPGPNPIASISQNHINPPKSGFNQDHGANSGPRLDLLLVHSEGLRVSILRQLGIVRQQIGDLSGFYAKVQAVATLLLTSYAFYAVVDPSRFSSPQDRFLRQLDYKKVFQDLQDQSSCVYSVHVNDYVFLRAMVQTGAEMIRRDFQTLKQKLAAALMDGIDIAKRCGFTEFQLETVQIARSGGLATSRLFGVPGSHPGPNTSILSQGTFMNDTNNPGTQQIPNLSDYSLGMTPRLLQSPSHQNGVCASPVQVPGQPGTVDAPGSADLASEAVCLAVLLNLCGVRMEPITGCYYPRLVSVDGTTVKEPGMHD